MKYVNLLQHGSVVLVTNQIQAMQCFVSACQTVVLQFPRVVQGIDVLATASFALLFKVSRQSSILLGSCCLLQKQRQEQLTVGILGFLISCIPVHQQFPLICQNQCV